MIRYSTLVISLALTIVSFGFAQQESPRPINPDTLKWFSPPSNPQFSATWITGNEKEEKTYIFRVYLKANGLTPPITHPDTRYGTILSGTLYVGFGKTIDDSSMVAIPSGEVYCIPANVTHYLKAGKSDVIFQEVGVGPTSTTAIGVFK